MEPPTRLEVSPQDAGLRLDVLLARELRLSRGYVRRLFARGAVRLDGRPAAKGAILETGDRVEVEPFRHPDAGPLAAPDLRIEPIAEGEGYLAVEKPAGLPCHPLDYDEAHTVLGAVAVLHPEVLRVGARDLQAGLVHRLDLATSGVLVFATEQGAWHRARTALAERRVDKRYVARVHGRLSSERMAELRLEQRGSRVVVVASGGRAAESRITPLEPGERTSLVEVRPTTGMRHQIRVTLAHLGHPVVGDRLYGSSVELGRHLLHSTRFALDSFEASSQPPATLLEEPEA
jgi:23S rRNA pseudouridine1911/1915/1917 synthase